MERSSASVGLGTFKCGSGRHHGARGWLDPEWVPIREAVAEIIGIRSPSGEVSSAYLVDEDIRKLLQFLSTERSVDYTNHLPA
jgi:hypothetical protein